MGEVYVDSLVMSKPGVRGCAIAHRTLSDVTGRSRRFYPTMPPDALLLPIGVCQGLRSGALQATPIDRPRCTHSPWRLGRGPCLQFQPRLHSSLAAELRSGPPVSARPVPGCSVPVGPGVAPISDNGGSASLQLIKRGLGFAVAPVVVGQCRMSEELVQALYLQ